MWPAQVLLLLLVEENFAYLNVLRIEPNQPNILVNKGEVKVEKGFLRLVNALPLSRIIAHQNDTQNCYEILKNNRHTTFHSIIDDIAYTLSNNEEKYNGVVNYLNKSFSMRGNNIQKVLELKTLVAYEGVRQNISTYNISMFFDDFDNKVQDLTVPQNKKTDNHTLLLSKTLNNAQAISELLDGIIRVLSFARDHKYDESVLHYEHIINSVKKHLGRDYRDEDPINVKFFETFFYDNYIYFVVDVQIVEENHYNIKSIVPLIMKISEESCEMLSIQSRDWLVSNNTIYEADKCEDGVCTIKKESNKKCETNILLYDSLDSCYKTIIQCPQHEIKQLDKKTTLYFTKGLDVLVSCCDKKEEKISINLSSLITNSDCSVMINDIFLEANSSKDYEIIIPEYNILNMDTENMMLIEETYSFFDSLPKFGIPTGIFILIIIAVIYFCFCGQTSCCQPAQHQVVTTTENNALTPVQKPMVLDDPDRLKTEQLMLMENPTYRQLLQNPSNRMLMQYPQHGVFSRNSHYPMLMENSNSVHADYQSQPKSRRIKKKKGNKPRYTVELASSSENISKL